MSPAGQPQDRRVCGHRQDAGGDGFSVDPDTLPGRYAAMTVDHLFGSVWTSDEIDLRQRRLLTIGVLAALETRATCSRSSSTWRSSVLS